MRSLLARLDAFGSGRLTATLLLLSLVALRMINPPFLEILQLRGFDLMQQLAPEKRRDIVVKVIDIDEKSLRALGQWPWPRDTMADLILRVGQAGAVVVGMDIVLAEPDRTSPARLAERLGEERPDMSALLRALPDHDRVLAGILSRSRIVLGQTGVPDAASGAERPPIRTPVAELGASARAFLPDYAGLVRNLDLFEQAAPGRGVFTLNPEPDGIVRRVPAMIQARGDLYPALSLEMLRVASGETTFRIRSDATGVQELGIGAFAIPVDARGRLWPHARPHEPSRYVPAIDLLEGLVAPDALAGKIVLFGTSAVGLHDLKTTPLERALPGVEVHAMILEGILQGGLLSRPPHADGIEVGGFLFLGIGLIVLIPSIGARFTGLGMPAILGSMGWGAWHFFIEHGELYDALLPAIGLALLAGYLIYSNYRVEERKRRAIRSTFSHYMAPALVDRLVKDPEGVRLGGERREITILFTDMRDFTTISESMDAQELLRYTNRYLGPTTQAIVDRNGTINKYIGDAAMAFWNAPLDDADHARNACLAVLSIRREIAALNETIAREAELAAQAGQSRATDRQVRIGMGVGTGICSVGNVGGETRREYTALGDPVNVAARLESQSKSFGVDNVVAETTIERAGPLAVLRLGDIHVKGRGKALRVFTVVGDDAMAAGDEFKGWARAHEMMLDHAAAGRWDEAADALALLEPIGEAHGFGAMYQVYRKRIAGREWMDAA
jgi:adenylate cyclase